jgi:hypothetical protein
VYFTDNPSVTHGAVTSAALEMGLISSFGGPANYERITPDQPGDHCVASFFRTPTAHRKQDDLCIDGRWTVTVAGVDVPDLNHHSFCTVLNTKVLLYNVRVS